MILAAGLTPAWQQIIELDCYRPGEVNRSSAVHHLASGKVINVALAAARLGAGCSVMAPLGGLAGRAIRREFRQRNIPARWARASVATRVCTTIIDSSAGTVTELVENAAPLASATLAEFMSRFTEAVSAASCAVLSGSLPAGTPPDFYRELVRASRAPVILDAGGEELKLALAARPLVVKPNRQELARTVGRPLADDLDLAAAMRDVCRQGASWVIVTQGAGPVLAYGEGRLYRANVPRLERVVNPIGSGDCLAAGVACGLVESGDVLAGLRLGIAAAVANAARLLPADFDSAAVHRAAGEIEIALEADH